MLLPDLCHIDVGEKLLSIQSLQLSVMEHFNIFVGAIPDFYLFFHTLPLLKVVRTRSLTCRTLLELIFGCVLLPLFSNIGRWELLDSFLVYCFDRRN